MTLARNGWPVAGTSRAHAMRSFRSYRRRDIAAGRGLFPESIGNEPEPTGRRVIGQDDAENAFHTFRIEC